MASQDSYYEWIAGKESVRQATDNYEPAKASPFQLADIPSFFPSKDFVDKFLSIYGTSVKYIISVGAGGCVLENLLASHERKVFCLEKGAQGEQPATLKGEHIEYYKGEFVDGMFSWLETKNINYEFAMLLFVTPECSGSYKSYCHDFTMKGGRWIVLAYPPRATIVPTESLLSRYIQMLQTKKCDVSTVTAQDAFRNEVKIVSYHLNKLANYDSWYFLYCGY